MESGVGLSTKTVNIASTMLKNELTISYVITYLYFGIVRVLNFPN